MRIIDADALLEKAWDADTRAGYVQVVDVGDILEAPTVTERKTGRWYINSDGYYPYCSECKNEPKNGLMTDFCPSCGADMRYKGY